MHFRFFFMSLSIIKFIIIIKLYDASNIFTKII